MATLSRRNLFAVAAGVMALSFGAAAVKAEPLAIRLGYSPAAEEQLDLLIADPSLGKNYGKLYTLNATRFSGSSARAQAFAAGAIDIASGGANGVLFAAAEGVKAKIIASLSKDALHKGYNTEFLALASSPIKKVEDLKGKTIGINGFSTTGELWLKATLERHGMSEKEVTVVPVSFAAMAESLRSGRIDVGEFPPQFYAAAKNEMKVRSIFTSKDGAPFTEELVVLIGHDAWLKAHAAAVRGFLADLESATKFYLAHTKEARQILLDKKFIRTPANIYLNMPDYYRDPNMRVSVSDLEKMQDLQVKAGFQKKKANVDDLVDMSYLPK